MPSSGLTTLTTPGTPLSSAVSETTSSSKAASPTVAVSECTMTNSRCGSARPKRWASRSSARCDSVSTSTVPSSTVSTSPRLRAEKAATTISTNQEAIAHHGREATVRAMRPVKP